MSTNPFQHSVRVAMASLLLLLAGCVTPPEVRVASSEVGAALTDLRAAGRDFEDAYIAELAGISKTPTSRNWTPCNN
jgi:hypothetical protein